MTTELEDYHGALSEATAAELERIVSDRRRWRSMARHDRVRRIEAGFD